MRINEITLHRKSVYLPQKPLFFFLLDASKSLTLAVALWATDILSMTAIILLESFHF